MRPLNRIKSLSKRTVVALCGAVTLATGLAVLGPAISSADNPSGCDFSPTNNGVQGCLGPLSGSTFAGGDGNLLTNPTTFGTTDWQNVAGLNPGFDLPSGTGDNSFGQGTKEDNPAVSVVSGSIPPNKSDLTRFYEASEIGSNKHTFLYLGWERTNVLGTANFDFEINQTSQPDLTTPGAKTLVRNPGDLLVTYDFTNGGGKPTIGLQRWLTTATTPTVPSFPTNVCFSSNTFPCWGDQLTLDGTDSIAAVNNLDAVSDPLFPTQPNAQPSVPALQFGETAIDLTKSGAFPPGCENFGSAFVKSRSSASFTAELKDFIAPIPVNISNCGSIKIIKHTDPRGIDQVFNYTSNLPAEPPGTVGGVPQGGVTCPGKPSAGVQADGSFCLNDAGNSAGGDSAGNTVFNNAVLAGNTYTVTEGAEPSGFTFEKLSCTGGTTSTSGETATINLKPNDNVVCTYVNQQNTATLATHVSDAGPVTPGGTTIHDTATVTGNQAADTPSGTVTFFLCGPIPTGSCSSGGTNIGTGTLGGSGATASAVSPDLNTTASVLGPGRYCFRAEWPGDTNYPAALIEFGGSSGTNECFTVVPIITNTTSTPSVGSGGTTTFGSTVTDHAVVQALKSGDGTPTGTVTFFVCDPTQTVGGACPDGHGTPFGSPVDTTAVAMSSPPASSADSSGVLANQTGTWCFRAVYTPGPPNGNNYLGSEDATTGECFTVTDTTGSSSNQDWLPNDTASVSSAHGAPLNGTLSVQLYMGDNCGVTSGSAVGGQLYSTVLSGASSPATLITTNTTFKVTMSSSVSWLVTFNSTDSNVASSSHCESTSLTINN
jgi:hypothetical protein